MSLRKVNAVLSGECNLSVGCYSNPLLHPLALSPMSPLVIQVHSVAEQRLWECLVVFRHSNCKCYNH